MREKILLVDKVNSRALCALLERTGYQVMIVSNSLEAIQELSATGPDLVIVDTSVIEQDSLELCRRIRRLDARLPIVVLATQGDEDGIVASLEAGADMCITQLAGEREFLARIGALLCQRYERAARPSHYQVAWAGARR